VHELGLCESVLDAVEKRAAGRRVIALRVKIGVLHRVPRESFDSAFTVMSTGSVAQGAAVDFVVLPVRVHCRSCTLDSRADDLLASCPRCGAAEFDSDGGDEVLLDSIALEIPIQTDSTG
jgi:hydrogenase nickel incorporation protein HypA/HybF